MEFELAVCAPHRKIVFRCTIHHSKSSEELLIEPEFYTRYGKTGIPSDDHYELELVETPWLPQGKHPIHIHHNTRSGRNFVCWPNELRTIEEAKDLFRVWCVGTTYTLIHGNDFVTLFEGDFKKFLNSMNKTCEIRIEE